MPQIPRLNKTTRLCVLFCCVAATFVLTHKHKARAAGQDGAPAIWAAQPDDSSGPAAATGVASWYGPGFIGRKTATGEAFDSEGMTAASPNLPLRSLIRVTNPRNGRSVVVRINDRGPYVKGRSIDLSRKAADLLGILRPGVAPVTLSMLDASGTQSSEIVDVEEHVNGDSVRLEVEHVQPGIHPDSSPMAGKLARASGAAAGHVARMLAATAYHPHSGSSRGNPFAFLMLAAVVGIAIVGQLHVSMQSLGQLQTVGVAAVAADERVLKRAKRLRQRRAAPAPAHAAPHEQIRLAMRRPGPVQKAPAKWRATDEAWLAQQQDAARWREAMRLREVESRTAFGELDDCWSRPQGMAAHLPSNSGTAKVETISTAPESEAVKARGTALLKMSRTGMLKEPSPSARWIRSGFPGNTVPLEINTDMVIEPGVYYGGITINPGAQVKMSAGLYIMAGGSLRLRSGNVDTTGVKVAYVPAELPTVEFSLGFDGDDPLVLRPGIYFGGVWIPEYQNVEVLPGLYVVASGDFNLPRDLATSDVTVYSL